MLDFIALLLSLENLSSVCWQKLGLWAFVPKQSKGQPQKVHVEVIGIGLLMINYMRPMSYCVLYCQLSPLSDQGNWNLTLVTGTSMISVTDSWRSTKSSLRYDIFAIPTQNYWDILMNDAFLLYVPWPCDWRPHRLAAAVAHIYVNPREQPCSTQSYHTTGQSQTQKTSIKSWRCIVWPWFWQIQRLLTVGGKTNRIIVGN